MNAKKIWDSYKFPLLLLGGIFTGAILGIILGEKAKVLAPLGDIFLNLMFTIVVPMVYVSITTAVGNMVNMKRLGKILGSLVCTFVVTGGFAAALVLVVVNIWPPAATCLNASGDTIASMMIARLIEGKDWLEKRIANGQVEVQL